ncbi:MAG: plasmid recombination protein [Acidobacteria bacterium]|nr:plasmid recombination protein [Acidobacteriota bacterium]
MPNFAIARHAKLKGSAVSLSAHHNLRTRETPNADQERTGENRILYGDERPLREKDDEKIQKTSARTRSDNVECVEYMLTATREHFLDARGEIDEGKLEQWIGLNMQFLHEECGADLLGAVLHMDETTPHIAAYRVPLKDGKLNCKAYYGTRELNRQFQDRYAEKMKPLGLERGVEKSRARHEDVRRFYGSITQEVKVQLRVRDIPDPPRMFVTKAQMSEYKETVKNVFVEQLTPQITILRDQALMAETEKKRRLAAEKRAAEKLSVAERERDQAVLKLDVEKGRNLLLLREHQNLVKEHDGLQQRAAGLERQVEVERVRDIPLVEVMHKFGCVGQERPDSSTAYLSEEGITALTIKDNCAHNHEGQLVAKNAIEMVLYMTNVNNGVETTRAGALEWLADNFGEKRAADAYLAEQKDALGDYFKSRREREKNPSEHQIKPPDSHEHERLEMPPHTGSGYSLLEQVGDNLHLH